MQYTKNCFLKFPIGVFQESHIKDAIKKELWTERGNRRCHKMPSR